MLVVEAVLVAVLQFCPESVLFRYTKVSLVNTYILFFLDIFLYLLSVARFKLHTLTITYLGILEYLMRFVTNIKDIWLRLLKCLTSYT